ncbi:MAG: tetratricopeptide repeat protein [Daejeonella sp.]|nr:tetratricopeptide repeat protein [Daejeonella sp.]
MKIKSLFLTFVLAGSTLFGFAQKGELNSAKSSYDKFAGFKAVNSVSLGITELKNAKASIDKVVVNEKTASDPSAWVYRALIYSDLASLDSVEATSKPLIKEATAALVKAKELDKAGAYKDKLDQVNKVLSNIQLNLGVKQYKASKFEDAYNSFSEAQIYDPTDTLTIYYGGLAAINAKNNKNAIKSYQALLQTNYSNNSQIYYDLSRLYAMEKDTASAIRTAAEGSKKYPKNSALATQEIELSLISGKQKEVISRITDQEAKEPTNKLYPFYLGIAYGSMKKVAESEAAYKRAIAVDPNYMDANLNLGSSMLNRGIDLYNKANKLPAGKQKEYDAMMKQANTEFDNAFPYLQKANELSPKSRLTLENLKTYYLIKKNDAKLAEITKKLKEATE